MSREKEKMETAQWFLDTSSPVHLTSDSNLLHDYILIEEPYKMYVANGVEMPVVGRGTLKTERYNIPDVLVVPGVRCNLISESKIDIEHELSVSYDYEYGQCFLKDKNGQEVGRGHRTHNGWTLDYLIIGEDVGDASLPAKADKLDRRLVLLRRGLALALALGSISFLLLLDKQPLLAAAVMTLLPVLVLGPVLLQVTLDRIMKFSRAYMHGRGGGLVKWGPHDWVLDSGASNHHTSNLELLLESGNFQFQQMDNKDAPSSGDDAAAPDVQGRGYVRTDSFDFPGVNYVVGDTRNVVSVSQLARDHGLVTVFELTSCLVKEKKTGMIVGKGRLQNGRYMLDSLRIVVQHIRDGGASGGDHHDGADGDGRGNGDGDSTTEGRGGGGRRDGRGGGAGTRARNQEEGSGSSGAAEGDVNNEITEEREGGHKKEFEEINENDEDDIKEIGEINGKGDEEDDEKRGGQNSGQLSSPPHKGLFGLSRLLDWIWWIVTGLWIIVDWIWWIISILCISACILQPYTGWGAGVTILAMEVAGLSVLSLFKTLMNTICIAEEILGPYLQKLSHHQEHNKRLFGLSRFVETTDPTGYPRQHLPARVFPTSTTNAARRPEDFFLDSGASFHTTWNESILFSYPRYLENYTKPPTLSLGGIAAGAIAVKRSGYLNGNNIMLDGVLLAPEAQANLVSVGQLSIYYKVKLEMDDQGVVINKWGVQIGRGRMLNNLYVLEYFLPGGLFAQGYTPQQSA